jgi:hypothetical protein
MKGGTFLTNMMHEQRMTTSKHQLESIQAVHLGTNMPIRFEAFMVLNGFKITMKDNLLTPYIVKTPTKDRSIDE